MIEWIIFALIGVLSGLSSGLLGLGGGVIIVPALLMVFAWQGLLGPHLMHMAITTSLMTIIVTSTTSAYSHHKHGNIDWHLVSKLIPGLVLGGLLGAALATQLSSQFLQQFFALYLLFAAIKMWLPNPSTVHRYLLNKSVLIGFGSIVGGISSLVGIGGGTLVVPYLVMANQPIQRAIGISATCGLPIAISAVAGFIIFGQEQEGSTMTSGAGFIHWTAFWGIISTSSIFAIVGVELAKKLPMERLKQIFSTVLLVSSVYLAIFKF
ncbi:MAG: sulfite exporter TauE/SafE family protein [Methylophaga sp.]|nr:sulfite exporter TauE/SafE family protein [Methylophaga sp.]